MLGIFYMLDRSIKCVSDGKDINIFSSRECESWRLRLKDEVVLFYLDFYCIFRGSCLYNSAFPIIFHANFEFFAIRRRPRAFSPCIISPVPLSVDFLPSQENIVSFSFIIILMIDSTFISVWINASSSSFFFTSFSVSFKFPSISICINSSTINPPLLSSSFIGVQITSRTFSFSVTDSLNEISLICISIPRKIYSFSSQCSIYILPNLKISQSIIIFFCYFISQSRHSLCPFFELQSSDLDNVSCFLKSFPVLINRLSIDFLKLINIDLCEVHLF